MMLIKMKTTLAGPMGCRAIGEEYECEDSEALALIEGGFADGVVSSNISIEETTDSTEHDNAELSVTRRGRGRPSKR